MRSPRPVSARRLRAGFTAVELAIVVILIGLMAALALPRVRTDNVAVDTAIRTINLSVMTAQRDAVARGHNVLVAFDAEQHTAVAYWDVNNNGVADPGEKSRPFLLPEAVRFARPSSVPALADDPAPGDETVTVILQRSGAVDRVRTIYLTTQRALSGGTPVDARALRFTRATGRPVWFAWTGTQWRQGS